jgi:hypothetical protein
MIGEIMIKLIHAGTIISEFVGIIKKRAVRVI